MIVVHPWGIDDGQGWRSPEPAGVAFQCTPAKNKIVLDHAAKVINPFLKAMRGKAGLLVGYSLPGTEDPIRRKIYRSLRNQPSEQERREGKRELKAKLEAFDYRGQAVPGFDHRRLRDADAATISSSSRALMPGRPTTAADSGTCRSP